MKVDLGKYVDKVLRDEKGVSLKSKVDKSEINWSDMKDITNVINIDSAIENYINIKNSNFSHSSESFERFYVSGAGFNCILAKYWSILNPKSFDLKIRKKMLKGEILHREIENIIKQKYPDILDENDDKCKITKLYEFSNSDEILYDNIRYMFTGRCDMKFIDNIEKVEVPIELKTFDDKWGMKYIPNKIHIMQLNMYLDMFNVEKGLLIYIGNSLDIYPFTIKKDENIIKEILSKYNKLSYYLKNRIEPLNERCENWECKECRYGVECMNKGKILKLES